MDSRAVAIAGVVGLLSAGVGLYLYLSQPEPSLTGLDSFAVDYTDRNLNPKLKNGKTYNFADPEGSADRLFVFHRDVDNVRGRLATQ